MGEIFLEYKSNLDSGFYVCSLASGSSGNSVYAKTQEGAILIDAGISGKRVREAIESFGHSVFNLKGLILTHGHSDHIKGAGVLQRRYRLELFMTGPTYEACKKNSSIGRLEMEKITLIEINRPFSLCGLKIYPIETPHDAKGSIGVILERDGLRCGILTDLGHCFDELKDVMNSLDAVFLESNYDPMMLRTGPYPYYLKRRIQSDYGHISNDEAADLVANYGGARLKTVILSHLSETNNRPQIALDCIQQVLNDKELYDRKLQILAAPRHLPSELVHITTLGQTSVTQNRHEVRRSIS